MDILSQTWRRLQLCIVGAQLPTMERLVRKWSSGLVEKALSTVVGDTEVVPQRASYHILLIFDKSRPG